MVVATRGLACLTSHHNKEIISISLHLSVSYCQNRWYIGFSISGHDLQYHHKGLVDIIPEHEASAIRGVLDKGRLLIAFLQEEKVQENQKMEVYSRSQIQVETKARIPIEYAPEENLVITIKEKMENLSLCGCISRACEEARIGNNAEQYWPMIVSIGPFHHGKGRLKAMEDQKWCYLNTLLSRNPNSNVDLVLDNCLKQLKRLEGKARKFYSENVDLTSDEFVQMMLVDGCFIIELFLKSAIKGLKRRDDPCFSPDKICRLTLDLILLENQIPFFIIEKLFHLVPVPKQCGQSPPQLALRFFRKLIQGGGEIPTERIISSYHHLLDLIRQFYLPTNPEPQMKMKRSNLKTATKIQAAGIKFKKGVAENLLNIKFDDGVLEIPPLRHNTYTETLFRNLIALEHRCSQYTKHFTSYAFLMRCLIVSKNDVKLLQRRGILIIAPDRRREILDLFQKPNVDENLTDFHYTGVCNQINSYRKKKLFQLILPCCK